MHFFASSAFDLDANSAPRSLQQPRAHRHALARSRPDRDGRFVSDLRVAASAACSLPSKFTTSSKRTATSRMVTPERRADPHELVLEENVRTEVDRGGWAS
jgi:hypothetical protein